MLVLRRTLLPALLLLVVSCGVTLIAPYDPEIDRGCVELHGRMDRFLHGLRSEPQATFVDSLDYYDHYELDVRALRFLARGHDQNDLSVQQFDNMLASLEQLRLAHSAGPLAPETADVLRDLFDISWSAIRRLELAKKRGDG